MVQEKAATSGGGARRRRWAAMVAIALIAWGAAFLAGAVFPGAVRRGDDYFYDTYYRARPAADMRDADVMLVAADDLSMAQVDKKMHYGWPWPRELWGHVAKYLDHAGAKAIVFDIVFKETSAYQDRTGDDDIFSDAIKSLKTPVVFGAEVKPDGNWPHFAPAIAHPRFGAVNLSDDRIYRTYRPVLDGRKSLAAQAVGAAGLAIRLPLDHSFLLHYYGPYQLPDGQHTFRYVSASNVLGAQLSGNAAEAKELGVSPDIFKGKIVVVGATALGTFDLKSSPLSEQYPGPEIQATAMENILRGDEVKAVGGLWLWLLPLCFALFVSAGVALPRRAFVKAAFPVAGVAILLALGVELFRGGRIVWLPPVESLIAIAGAALLAFAWSYFAEDRQRRFMLKALTKVVSPAVAHQLAAEPGRLALGTQRGELTILFTDLADFTTLAEGMDVEALGEMLNVYLQAMSDRVLAEDGTLDKYIGDAVMCFWNAPLPQKDHAARACRTALAMAAAEKELREKFAAMGAKRLFTRIGINTDSVAIGFVGSSHLFNYTVLGDGVNLASRVEGANKIYGTQILITEKTAALVEDHFHLRKVDVIRVKGKREPMALFELLGEKGAAGAPGDSRTLELITRYDAAFAEYQRRNWAKCEQLLLELFAAFGEDGPSRALEKRVRGYRVAPPAESWDGVHESTEK